MRLNVMKQMENVTEIGVALLLPMARGNSTFVIFSRYRLCQVCLKYRYNYFPITKQLWFMNHIGPL